jgi:hypothetical protein
MILDGQRKRLPTPKVYRRRAPTMARSYQAAAPYKPRSRSEGFVYSSASDRQLRASAAVAQSTVSATVARPSVSRTEPRASTAGIPVANRRENDFACVAANQRRYLAASPLDGVVRPTTVDVPTRRIAEMFSQVRQHDIDDLRLQRCRRVVIEVNRICGVHHPHFSVRRLRPSQPHAFQLFHEADLSQLHAPHDTLALR